MANKQQKFFFSQFWSLGTPKSRGWQVQCLARPHFLVHRWPSSHCILVWWEGVKDLSEISYQDTNPIHEGSPHNLIIFWRQIPSHWALGFNIWILGGGPGRRDKHWICCTYFTSYYYPLGFALANVGSLPLRDCDSHIPAPGVFAITLPLLRRYFLQVPTRLNPSPPVHSLHTKAILTTLLRPVILPHSSKLLLPCFVVFIALGSFWYMFFIFILFMPLPLSPTPLEGELHKGSEFSLFCPLLLSQHLEQGLAYVVVQMGHLLNK